MPSPESPAKRMTTLIELLERVFCGVGHGFHHRVITPVIEPSRGVRGTAACASSSAHVFDASKMLWIDVSSVASNSASLCCADRPSVSAREKLAITPWLRASRALASSRE